MKKPTVPKLKKKLDKIFSLYIRQKYADSKGYCYCITCSRKIDWKYKTDAGHFIERDVSITRYDERNVHPQCKRCNMSANGQQYLHGLYINKKYGKGTADELMRLRWKTHQFATYELEEMIKVYTTALKELEAE